MTFTIWANGISHQSRQRRPESDSEDLHEVILCGGRSSKSQSSPPVLNDLVGHNESLNATG